MLSRLRTRLTFANVVSLLALFVALSGGAYAAFKLPANSVGSKQLKSHAVTPVKVAPKTIKLFKGQTGAPGKPGSARAYAYVMHGTNSNPGPRFDPARTKGFASVKRASSDGVYCLTPSPGIDPAKTAPVVTAVWNNGVLIRVRAQLTDLNRCGAGQFEVYTYLDSNSDTFPHGTNAVDFTVALP